MKRLLAAFLCGTVLVSSVSPVPTVYAAQEAGEDFGLSAADESENVVADDVEAPSTDDDRTSDEMLSDLDDRNDDGDDTAQEKELLEYADDTVPADGTPDDSADGTSEEPEDDPLEGSEIIEGAAGNDEAYGEIDDQSKAQTQDEDAAGTTTSQDELPEGVNGLPAGFTVSSNHKEMKRNAINHDMFSTFEAMKEDVDYVADEVITLADSREEAEAIAYAYSGQLKEFSYGVATISLAGSGISAGEAFELALDKNLELPYVEPGFVCKMEEPVENAEIEDESNLLSYSDNTVPAGRGFSDWWYGTDDPDPYLNPDNSYYQWLPYQWHHGMINTYSAWGVTTGRASVEVAVIDTGVNASHSDFIRSDGSKVVDSENGWNFISDNVNFADDNNHGTHVAGIIAAALNGKLGAGVAPGVTILPLKVCDEKGFYSEDNLARAIRYAAGFNKDGSESDNVGAILST